MRKKRAGKKKEEKKRISDQIHQYFENHPDYAITSKNLFHKLSIPNASYPVFKDVLNDFVNENILKKKHHKYQKRSSQSEKIVGTLRVHPRGFGFVQPLGSPDNSKDIFIPRKFIHDGIDGDQVEVEIYSRSSPKGPEGGILKILERQRKNLIGTIKGKMKDGYGVYIPILGASKTVVVKSKKRLKIGDRISMQVSDWGEEIFGELTCLLAPISDASQDIYVAIQEFNLRDVFPQKVIEETKTFGKKVTKKDLENRRDLTGLITITIDPDTAKDFDDALSLTKDSKGNFRLGVHIADVAYYVKNDTALDKEASLRGNSTYFPGKVIPMLPEELSNHLCSLKPNVLRLCVSVLMELDPKGNLKDYQIVRSYIRSSKRFTYGQALSILENKTKSPYQNLLKQMVELCLLFKKKRMERGSIDFALPEAKILVDKQGNPTNIQINEYDITHQLVEEFMLKANEVVAKNLNDRGKDLIYRIHEEPSFENIQEFYSLARLLGFRLPSKPTHLDIQKLFQEVKNTPFGHRLSVSFIRSMKLAFYSPQNIGHYGLALEHYCHFTSPIRRYADLIIQRLLFDEEKKDLNLTEIATKCSDTERMSFRTEMSVSSIKKLRLLNQFFTEDPYHHFEAIVTNIKPYVLFFEVSNLFLEGSVHVSELQADFFIFEPRLKEFRGRNSGIRYRYGDKIEVMLKRIDLIMLEAHWILIEKAPLLKKFRKRKQKK